MKSVVNCVALFSPSASSLVIDRICTDSRGAAPGALFVALKGQQTDGHRFLGRCIPQWRKRCPG